MANIYAVADQHTAAVRAHEAAASKRMLEAYIEAANRLKPALEAMTEQIAAAQEQYPDGIPLAWLNRQERLATLLRQVQLEINHFAASATGTISQAQAEVVAQAQTDATEQVKNGLDPDELGIAVSLNQANTKALTSLIGFLGDGSPLHELLGSLGEQAAADIKQALTVGLTIGEGPRKVAARMKGALGNNLARALRISRTEILRSYREAAKATYEANADVVKGWVWHSARNARTCASCWALHGTFHPVTERLSDHVCGRCAPVPITRTWEELGVPGASTLEETQHKPTKGPDDFEALSDFDKLRILGPGKYGLYKSGKIALVDLVTRKQNPVWGLSHVETPLYKLQGGYKGPTLDYTIPAVKAHPTPPTAVEEAAAQKIEDAKKYGQINASLYHYKTQATKQGDSPEALQKLIDQGAKLSVGAPPKAQALIDKYVNEAAAKLTAATQKAAEDAQKKAILADLANQIAQKAAQEAAAKAAHITARNAAKAAADAAEAAAKAAHVAARNAQAAADAQLLAEQMAKDAAAYSAKILKQAMGKASDLLKKVKNPKSPYDLDMMVADLKKLSTDPSYAADPKIAAYFQNKIKATEDMAAQAQAQATAAASATVHPNTAKYGVDDTLKIKGINGTYKVKSVDPATGFITVEHTATGATAVAVETDIESFVVIGPHAQVGGFKVGDEALSPTWPGTPFKVTKINPDGTIQIEHPTNGAVFDNTKPENLQKSVPPPPAFKVGDILSSPQLSADMEILAVHPDGTVDLKNMATGSVITKASTSNVNYIVVPGPTAPSPPPPIKPQVGDVVTLGIGNNEFKVTTANANGTFDLESLVTGSKYPAMILDPGNFVITKAAPPAHPSGFKVGDQLSAPNFPADQIKVIVEAVHPDGTVTLSVDGVMGSPVQLTGSAWFIHQPGVAAPQVHVPAPPNVPAPPPTPTPAPPPVPNAGAGLPVPHLDPFPQPPFDVASLTRDTSIQLQGVHEKHVYTDATGGKWMFKPQEDWRTANDVALARLQKLAGLPSPEMYHATIGGRPGSLQSMFANVRPAVGAGATFDPTKVNAKDAAQLQKFHVFDWMVANHDAHADQFLKVSGTGGQIVEVDTGASFKFFGKGGEKLHYSYDPQALNGSVNHKIAKAYAQGQAVQFVAIQSSPELRKFAEDLQKIPDNDYKAALRGYAVEAKKLGFLSHPTVDQFLDAAVARKNSLVADFEQYHADLEAERRQALGLPNPNQPQAVRPIPPGLKGMAGARDFSLPWFAMTQAQQAAQIPTADQAGKAWAMANMPADSPSQPERSALQNYQGSSYLSWNAELRSGRPLSTGLKRITNALDRAIGRSAMPEDTVVWRGSSIGSLEPQFRADPMTAIGEPYEDKAYMSTSIGATPAAIGAGQEVWYRIRLKKGSKAYYIDKNIMDGGEREIILSRGKKFHIHNVYQVEIAFSTYSAPRKKWVVEMEEI